MEPRTSQQNRALYKYFELVAESLNDAGLDIETVVKEYKVDVPWSKEAVKELLWKTVQRPLLQKESTADLEKHEINQIWEVINRFLAKLGVDSIPFPHEDGGV